MLLSDDELNGADKKASYEALIFSYKTTLVRYSSNITEVAVQLRAELEKRKALESCEQIYFVTHSMGGLVTKRMLLSLANEGETDRLARIRGLFFIGTPTYGSKLGSVAKWLSFNPQFQNMEPMDINTYLQTLDHDWQDFLRKRTAEGRKFPLSFCAYEATPTFWPWVVDRVSAAPNCDSTPLSIDKDHIGIVKPESRNTEPYPMVKKHILELSKDLFLPNRRVVLMDSAYPWRVYDDETQKNGGTNADDIIPILDDAKLDLISIKELVYPRWADLQRIKELNPGLIIVHLSSFSGFSEPPRIQDDSKSTPPHRTYTYKEVRRPKVKVEEFEYFLRNALEALPETRFLIYSRLDQMQKQDAEQRLDVLAKELAESAKLDEEKTRKRMMLFAVCPTYGRNNNPSKHSFKDPITQSVFKSYVRTILGDLNGPQSCPIDSSSCTGPTDQHDE
jgi:pimeloyl-ACP methyl ester carboxylesterase